MDYHSALVTVNFILFNLLSILTPAATVLLLFIAVVLYILSFLIAGSEVAFFSLNIKDINALRTRQQPSFRRIVTLLEQPKTLQASMLIANVFVNLGAILVTNFLLDNWMSQLGLSISLLLLIKVLIISVLLVLFSEVLPKVWAAHHKVWFAASSSLVIEIFNSIFYALSKRIVKFTDKINKQLSAESNTALDKSNLDYAIDLLPDHEATVEEKQILKGIRKFGDTEVKQIMRTRMDVSGIDYNSSFAELMKKVTELHYSRLPVYKGSLDDIAGMLQTKDLLPYLHQPENFDWHSLIRTPYFVHEQKLIEDLLQEFRAKRIHFAIVVDEFGGTSGIATLEDIMEEIIGEIEDEFDNEESINKKIDDYNYIFEGKFMINDACKAMKLPADTFDAIRGDSDSVAGLVLEIAGEFPHVNTNLVSGDFTFVPLEINKNRIDKVKIIIQPATAPLDA
ncbi:MAG TPA: gliding motility-associated protein GldE [Ferruginibacter sp.]|nr:gliding motility-associated protein GldE [Ferruginibacter sp.]